MNLKNYVCQLRYHKKEGKNEKKKIKKQNSATLLFEEKGVKFKQILENTNFSSSIYFLVKAQENDDKMLCRKCIWVYHFVVCQLGEVWCQWPF